MLVLVTGTPVFPSKNNFVKAITKQFPEIKTVVQNINPYRTNLVLGDVQKVLYGKDTLKIFCADVNSEFHQRVFIRLTLCRPRCFTTRQLNLQI